MAVFIPRFLRSLRDVDTSGVADGDALTYDSGTETWIPGAGGGGGDLTDAVILAPATSARNVIQPTAGDVIAAIVKAHAAQSVDLTQWQTSAGVVLGSVGPTGILTLDPTNPADPAILIEGNPGSVLRTGLIVDPVNFLGAALVCDGTVPNSVDLIDTVGWGPGGSFNNLSWGTNGIDGQQFVTIQLGAVGTPYTNEWTLDGFRFKDTASVQLFRVLQNGEVFIAKAGGTLGFLGATPVLQQTAASLADLWTALKDYGLLDAGSSAPASGGAPTTATYITQTPDAGLSAEQALSALATGLVKNTTGTGVLSIGAQGTDYWAPGGTDVAVADGGTGASTAAGARTNLDVPSNAEAVLDTLFDANTVLAADSDNTPAALTMGASTILARLAAGNIKAATPVELRTLLDVPTNAEAVLDTIVDAKGDLIVGTAADTVARLATGTNFSDELVPDSAAASGLRWSQRRTAQRPTGSLYETYDRRNGGTNGALLLASRVHLVAIDLPNDLLITSVTFVSSTTAASVPTVQQFGIYDDSAGSSSGTPRALLRATNDDGSAAWAAQTAKTLNLTSTYTTIRSGLHYLGIVVVATTVPSLHCSPVHANLASLNLAPLLCGRSTAGQSSLPNPAGAISAADTSVAYAFVS